GEDEERVAATAALGRYGAAARKAFKALVRATGDPERRVRQEAVALLDWLEPRWSDGPEARAALPWLIEGLKSHSDRVPAIEALARLGPTARPALDRLYEFADDRRDDVRHAARVAIRRIQGRG